jgi:hypothetical protein
LKLVIFVKVLRTAVAANARHPASPLARQAAVSQISSAKTRSNKNSLLKAPPELTAVLF